MENKEKELEELSDKAERAEDVAPEAETLENTKKKSKKKENEALEARIAELEGKLAECEDKHLRMAAEYENFRRRSREEHEGVYASAVGDTVAELLPIIDNLERAEGFTDADKVREGLVMISSSVAGALSKLGVEAFGAVGDKFDPNLHNAVMHEENEELGEGEITAVFQKGYKKGNKIIRFAMVKTAN